MYSVKNRGRNSFCVFDGLGSEAKTARVNAVCGANWYFDVAKDAADMHLMVDFQL